MWLTLLNESYFDKYKIKRGDIIGYLVIEPEVLKVHYEKKPPNETWRHPDNYLPKDWEKNWKNTVKKRKMSRHQVGAFLNRYDFAYAGRDVVNQVGKIVPGVIDKATGEIDKIARQRIDQAIKSGGAEIERVAPKIIRGAIEEVYKTPFKFLGNLGKNQFQKIKRKLFKYSFLFCYRRFYICFYYRI